MSNKLASPAVEEIWSLLKETDRQIKALSAENRARSAETDRQIKALSAETEKTSKGLREARNLFTSQWGKLMESLVEGDLIRLLNEKNIEVESTLTNMKGEHKGKNWELDIIAINGKELVLVEVKTTLKVRDIERFKEKLKIFTTWRPEYKGKRIYGAVAYLRVDENSAKHAEKQGLFVIKATGNSASIINKKDFEPKAFS